MNFPRLYGLRPSFTPFGIWAFSIGTSIGWGSFIVTCNAYLQKSGILGTTFGFLVGMAVILVITWNLQYMIQHEPDSGGIYTFERKVEGKDFGFLAAWFVLLAYLAVLWANITSIPLFAKFFLGNTFQFGFHYNIFGYEIWFGEVLLSICSVIIVGILCSRSSRLPNLIMIIAASVFALGFTICAVFAILKHENTFNYSPLYAEGSNALAQIARIAAISPWAFIGFENVSHFSEEYAFSVKKIRKILIWSVLITTLLYLLVSFLSISAYPPEYKNWMDYMSDMENLSGIKAVPAFYAANYYLGQTGITVLLLALFGVILTSLIGNMLALSRLLYAVSREGEAPQILKNLNQHGIPDKAIFAIVSISVMIPFLGRTAIGWIVDVTTIGATLIYGMICHAVYKHAKEAKILREQCTGIIGLILMCCFLLLLMVPGLLPFHAMETESYVLFIIWSVLGLAYFRKLVRQERYREYGKSYIVWIILLMLVLFASMMWVSRATENAAYNAATQIVEYHENNPVDDSDIMIKKERILFLREQANQISSTNTLYTIVSLGFFILSTLIMLENYRNTRELGEQLFFAEEAAKTAQKIAELRASLSGIFNNMPGMSFSKDAKNGVYLACNQSFAEYAHKANPEEVVGLTDAEIFDPVTAAHFVEDDKIALSMDKPYIFYEDVPDAAGNQRQFQTTKLKYTDDIGRLCILGLCEDVSEFVRIQRENATTKKAYEKAKSAGVMYNHIAQTLARGYTDLYYINLDTEEFIEYQPDNSGKLNEVRRGSNFFEQCKKDAELYIHSDDRIEFLKALERKKLLDTLNRKKSFIMNYRLLSNNKSNYVSMNISLTGDDERFIVIGIIDVDEQMKQQRAAEQLKEERIAYTRLNALIGDFICVYVVTPETDDYREYSATEGFEYFAIPKEGTDFFGTSREEGRKHIYKDDILRFLSLFTKENVLFEIERRKIFSLTYRLVIKNKPTYVQLKAAMVNEKEGARLIVGINDIDADVRQEEDYAKRLAQAQSKANVDALTGVKNRHAYLSAEEELNCQIAENKQTDFAITVLDVNDLKKVNDNSGHHAGDKYLQDACKIICDIFKNSSVFRVGGDEFAVISQGEDYSCLDELLGKVTKHNIEALHTGGIVIACGMAKYENDICVAHIFERADKEMYHNKNSLKSEKKGIINYELKK